jgi:hypothetical protein
LSPWFVDVKLALQKSKMIALHVAEKYFRKIQDSVLTHYCYAAKEVAQEDGSFRRRSPRRGI